MKSKKNYLQYLKNTNLGKLDNNNEDTIKTTLKTVNTSLNNVNDIQITDIIDNGAKVTIPQDYLGEIQVTFEISKYKKIK